MRCGLRAIALALAILGAVGCREEPPPPPVPLTVLATSSLEKFAVEAADAFEATANVKVEVRTAGTHELAGELAAELTSAPSADLFLAAGLDWMDRLEEQGVIVPQSRWEAVGNRMVILGREEARYPRVRFVDAATLGFRRIVVADPSREPAGRWARRWLEDVGLRGETLWRQLEPRREVVANVGDVLQAVANDPATVGVVFATDIGRVPGGTALFRSPDLGIRYSFALVDRPQRPPQARELLDFLQSPAGLDLLRSNGFLLEEGGGRPRRGPE